MNVKTQGISLIFIAVLSGMIWFSSCQKDVSCSDCNEQNKQPIAMAGPDQVILLPTNIVSLDGSASSDPDGKISSYYWKKISGPPSFSIIKPSESKTDVDNLGPGIYQFELEVTDDGGLSEKDTIKIIVRDPAQPNRPPLANAGANQQITLPIQTANLNGSASSDPDDNIASFGWTKISGPSSFSIANDSVMVTQVINLEVGDYLFELKVTDSNGLSDTDTLMIIVSSGNNSSPVDIYISGDFLSAPKYWKNGQEVLLPDGPADEVATSIAVVGNDVYVAGTEYRWPAYGYGARYWKNGQEVRLTGDANFAGATSIAVSGNDVYVAGWEYEGGKSIAKYWKNGQEVKLTNGTNDANANCIVAVGNDVYVAGTEEGPNGYEVAKYWKNGQAVSLGRESLQSYANYIVLAGNDIYVAGSEEGVAKYWKNGQEVILSNGPDNASATSIAVVGNDVYVAGYQGDYYHSVAKYWKNGQEFSLSGSKPAIASSIAVYNTEVYVAGYCYIGAIKAKYWRNGQEIQLPNGVLATSIILVER